MSRRFYVVKQMRAADLDVGDVIRTDRNWHKVTRCDQSNGAYEYHFEGGHQPFRFTPYEFVDVQVPEPGPEAAPDLEPVEASGPPAHPPLLVSEDTHALQEAWEATVPEWVRVDLGTCRWLDSPKVRVSMNITRFHHHAGVDGITICVVRDANPDAVVKITLAEARELLRDLSVAVSVAEVVDNAAKGHA